jgi:class 3 adenylate cyclase
VAFRIEQMNKQLGSALLVSEAVRQAVPGVEFTATPLSLAIRGRQQPVQVYRLA